MKMTNDDIKRRKKWFIDVYLNNQDISKMNLKN